MEKDKVIFVDWFGVSSNDNSWGDIPHDDPLYQPTQDIITKSFGADDHTHVSAWMKGDITDHQAISDLLPNNTAEQVTQIIRRHDTYMDGLDYNTALYDQLKEYYKTHYIALATDNFGMFDDCIESFDCASVFDAYINSYRIRALKAQNPQTFFGTYLQTINKTFADSILIDDRSDNIKAFEAQGGTGVLYRYEKNSTDEMLATLDAILKS